MKIRWMIFAFVLPALTGCYVNEPPQDARSAYPPQQQETYDEGFAGENGAPGEEGEEGDVPPPAPGSSDAETDGPVHPGPSW